MRALLFTSLILSSGLSHAKTDEEKAIEQENMKQCVLNELVSGDEQQTLVVVKEKCRSLVNIEKMSAIDKRLVREQVTEHNPNVITPHKRNYILPLTYMERKSDVVIESPFNEAPEEFLDNMEAKFQVSLKVPLFENFSDKDQAIHFGFTLQSYWQVYNSDISAPFRETNYQPEIFWSNVLDEENRLWGDEMITIIGMEHQSNGRSNPLSRSWNRIYANLIWEHSGYVFSFKPWYRLPEDEKEDPNQPEGDDNPDIHHYMGYFEFSGAFKRHDHEYSFMLRNNLESDNKGALQLDWSFPVWGRLRGYAQYFNGYGESLIDYNQHVERFGVGVLLTGFL